MIFQVLFLVSQVHRILRYSVKCLIHRVLDAVSRSTKDTLFLRFFIFIWNKNKRSTHKEECSHNLLPLCTFEGELLVYIISNPTVTGYSNINSVTF